MSEEVARITIQLAPPRGSFPGKVAQGHFKVIDGTAFLTYSDGTPIDRYRLTRKIPPGADARTVAGNLLRERYSGSSSDFNLPLHYPRMGKI
jgi:hypothetical protein